MKCPKCNGKGGDCDYCEGDGEVCPDCHVRYDECCCDWDDLDEDDWDDDDDWYNEEE